jgi:hypothetical protein
VILKQHPNLQRDEPVTAGRWGIQSDLAAYELAPSIRWMRRELFGVASPHTKGQLGHIQRLKAKHGIDYDSHGSYRFVEK